MTNALEHWTQGYYAESGYTFGVYPEALPFHMEWAALLQGHRCRSRAFRFLDAGCGQGLHLLMAAAAHPEAEFVGVDFMPEHVAHGQRLAAACGLRNVTFVEADFQSLAQVAGSAQTPEVLRQPFDYLICHGITAWITPPVRQSLMRWAGMALAPGGVMYNGYNTFPGWLGMVPFQKLVRLTHAREPGLAAVRKAQDVMSFLKEHSPALLNAQPFIGRRLEMMKKQEHAYLVQEFNNAAWQPRFVSDVIEECSAHKLQYLGTATLPEAFDELHPTELRQRLADSPSVAERELLRDLAMNQVFRRDLYVKGRVQPWKLQKQTLLDESRWIRSPLVRRPAEGQPYAINGTSLSITGSSRGYGRILDVLETEPQGMSTRTLRNALDSRQRPQLVQALTMMLHGGWVSRLQDQAVSAAQVNRTLLSLRGEGAPYLHISLPRLGLAAQVPDTERHLLALALSDLPREDWARGLLDSLKAEDSTLARDGRAITDPDQALELACSYVEDFVKLRLGFYRTAGAV